MAYYRAPDPINSTFFIPGTNTPGSGVKAFFYSNKSSTKVTVYQNTAGTPWSNPIVLDSGGNLPNGGSVYIASGQTLTVTYAPANDSDPPASTYAAYDDVTGIGDVSAAASEWIAGPTPIFVSATQFTLVGDQTAIFETGRWVKSTNTGGTVYSRIANSSFGAVTTVNVVNYSGVLDAGLSAVSYALLDATNPSFGADHVNRKATAVASAGSGTTNIWGVNGDFVHVTGTNAIFNFSSSAFAGNERTVIFDGILPINSSAALSIPGGNVTTAAGDRAFIRAENVTSSIISFYQRASGSGIAATGTTLTVAVSTYITPVGVIAALVEIVGGGGGGGGCISTAAAQCAAAGGGGGGGYAAAIFTASQLGVSQLFAVGRGGGGLFAATGRTGTTTTFGTATSGAFLSATGGVGGGAGTNVGNTGLSEGGAGGLGSSGAWNMQGGGGSFGVASQDIVTGAGGAGGSSVLGGGGRSVFTLTSTTGVIGGLYGGGGSGSALGQSQSSTAGAAGAQGVIKITEFY